ncbi:MAG: sulfatase-like hydrolase/transferase [Acidobacteriota bacterium]
MTARRARVLGGLATLVALAACSPAPPPAEPAWPAAALPGGNVLLVTVDTLRADRLTPATMPALSRLAERGRRFTTTYAHAPMTLPSHASILTGLLPPAHGVRGNAGYRLVDGQTTLAERLHARGYRTGAFVGAFVLDARFGLAQGFDRYSGVDDDRPFAGDFAYAERPARAVLNEAAAWILDPSAAEPWLAWVHVFDPHAPYGAPPRSGLSGYDADVHETDRALGDFLERLRAAGALARTFVVVTADHGEGLGEHGEATHGLFAYDTTMRVPLVVAGPRVGRGVHTQPAAHIDLVPTVLEVLGVTADPSLPGRPLRDVAAAGSTTRAVYLEAMEGWLTARAAPVTAVVAEGWKLVDVPVGELYNVAADPGERENVWARDPARRRALEARLKEFGPAATLEGAELVEAGEAAARLRALGYAAAGTAAPAARFSDVDDPKAVRPLYERFLATLGGPSPSVDALREIVAARPAFEAARLAAASLLIEQSRAAEAVPLLEEGRALAGAGPALDERLAVAFLAAGRHAEAVAMLDAVVSRPGASADAWNALGVARAETGRSAAALAAFDRAVTLAPAAGGLRVNRAVARLRAGDTAGAEADVLAALEARPAWSEAWRLLATARYDRGDRAGAIAAWTRLVDLVPADADALFNLAVTARDLGRQEEAARWARRFLAAVPPGARPDERRIIERLLR